MTALEPVGVLEPRGATPGRRAWRRLLRRRSAVVGLVMCTCTEAPLARVPI